MYFKNVYSIQPTIEQAVQELKNKLEGFESSLILFFASSQFDAAALSAVMQQTFQGCTTVGCTTSGEITSGKMLDQAIVAMAFHPDALLDFNVEVLTNIRSNEKVVDEAFASFSDHFNCPMADIDPTEYVGLVLIDGLSGCEEVINERIGDLTNVAFVGGSAGDDLQFKTTYIYANGKAYEEAALLLLMKPALPFSILKTQSFQDTGKVLTVTETNETRREITTLNHQPARAAYAEALQVTEEELTQQMFKNPLGLMLTKDNPFVRSPRVIEEDRVLFYCNVKKGMDLHLLRSTDIVDDTQKALQKEEDIMGPISAIINFNCILRTLDLKEQKRTQEYASLFAKVPTVGFSTYGESYIGHINQTATMLVFHEQ